MPLRPRHGGRSHGAFWRHWSFFLYVFAALLGLAAAVCFLKSGRWLVVEDKFEKARWALVLAGEGPDAERSEAALKLYLDGRIDTLIYSGCRIFKDRYASEFMTDWLSKQGYPREKLFEFRQDTYSTQEEATLLIRQFRWQNLDTVVIITANFHTARTRRIFRELAQGYPHILVYPAEFKDFEPGAWWSSREGRKWWLTEWTKTVSTFFELVGSPPETGKAEVNGLISAVTGSAPAGAAVEPRLPAPTREDSLAAAALDSAARADSAAAHGDTSSARPTAAGDSAATAADSAAGRTGKTPSGDSAAKEPAPSKESLAASAPAAKKEIRAKEPETAKASTKPAAKSSKSEPAKTPAKKTDKTPEKSSSKSDKEKEKDKKKSR